MFRKWLPGIQISLTVVSFMEFTSSDKCTTPKRTSKFSGKLESSIEVANYYFFHNLRECKLLKYQKEYYHTIMNIMAYVI